MCHTYTGKDTEKDLRRFTPNSQQWLPLRNMGKCHIAGKGKGGFFLFIICLYFCKFYNENAQISFFKTRKQ